MQLNIVIVGPTFKYFLTDDGTLSAILGKFFDLMKMAKIKVMLINSNGA